ncbi:MAG: hypothetical protein HY553_00500 [Elusimicrobia bacterium]|nr:hypothetical protein [Elusimicrobiota bacterium]
MSPALLRLTGRLYRRYWKRLLFFSACVGAGVTFLVAVGHVRASVESAVARQARELLAGDVELFSHRPFAEPALSALARLEGEGHATAVLLSFSSMLSAPGRDPFLVSVKAIGPGYPFYGRLSTEPAEARLEGASCLLDEAAASQQGLRPGDTVRLGDLELRVAGLLLKEPDRTMAGFNLAPRLMIPLDAAGRTGLLRFGSRLRYIRLLRLPPSASEPSRAAELKARLERELDDPYLSITAYTDADPAVRQALERVGSFFVFLSLVGLLLGAVGMSASVSMFLNDQVESVGTLRCLGLTPREVGLVYGLLCLAVGLQGGLLGGVLGWAAGAAALGPAAKALQLTIDVSPRLEWRLVAEGVAVACALALALNGALVAALSRVSPLEALRGRGTRLAVPPGRRALVAAAGLAALFLYAFAKSNSWPAARSFTLALAGCSAVTVLLILAANRLLARAPLERLTFAPRHGLLALTRHTGRTLVLLFTLSLGLTLLGALAIVHRSLSSEILLGRSERAPDHFLVDIQKSQLAGVQAVLDRYATVIAQPAPLIRARLTHIDGAAIARRDVKGMTAEELARQRFLTREYNLTYKDELQESERIVAGKMWEAGTSAAEISLERSFAKRIGVGLGARLVFDVQGRPVEGTVTSLRRVEWISMRPNFFVVFPRRVLEPAPQIFITSVRVGEAAKASALRRELGRAYANVSVVDLSKVLDNVQSMLGTLITALRLLAWFCLGVGLLVLAGTLGLGRAERVRQAALYRTLGCTASDVARMDAMEFVAVGAIALLIAATTSHLLAWAVAHEMQVGMATDGRALAWMAAAALLLPPLVGLAVYRPAYRDGVIASLRDDA